MPPAIERIRVGIPADAVDVDGGLTRREGAFAVGFFAHGSGSSRFSPRNRRVPAACNAARPTTVLVDLLLPEEESIDIRTAQSRITIGRLAERLIAVTDWLASRPETSRLSIGYFGAST